MDDPRGRARYTAVALGWLLIALSVPARAQTDTATIRVSVVDPTGAVVPNAAVRLIDLERGSRTEAATGSGGGCTFVSVRPGEYEIQVEKGGFKLARIAEVPVKVLDSVDRKVTLQLGPVVETVRVDAAGIDLNATTGTVSAVIDRHAIDTLPLNGRSLQTLIMITPGVVVTTTALNDQGQFSVNGQRADANYFTVDGVSANFGVTGYFPLVQAGGGALPALTVSGGTNSLVSVEALQEFRVLTSSFAPEFGRTPGGQISVVTRSGTNTFHATAFEYYRDGGLDANDWFANLNRLPKPDERQHDFGGVFGGPLQRTRSFFFTSYERLRLRQPVTRQSTVPDLTARQQAPIDLRPFLNAYPIPNGPATGPGVARFDGSYSNPSAVDASSIRIDHVLAGRHRAFARYNYSPSSLEQRAAPFTNPALSTIGVMKSRVHTFTVGVAQPVTPSVAHEARLNYSRHTVAASFAVDEYGGAVPPDPFRGFPPGFTAADSAFLFLISGVGQYGSGLAGIDEQWQVNLTDNLSVLAGRHHAKFGLDYRRLAPSSHPFRYRQFVQFSGLGAAPGGALSGIAGFAQPVTYEANELRSQNVSLYAQDSWRAAPRLTVTYGLRWDVNPSLRGKNDAHDPFTVEGIDTPATMTLAPRGTPLYRTTYGNVAPRVGVAYQLHRAVLRGGLGTFYDLGHGSLGGTSAFFPHSASRNLALVPFPLSPDNAAAPALRVNPPVDQILVADARLKLPRTHHWNAAIEQSLGASQAVSLTYVGAAGRELLRVTNLLNPNPLFQLVLLTTNTARSDYDSLQVRYERRLSRGLQAVASYTWAHSTDTASTDAAGTNLNTPASAASSEIDRGDSDFDIRHSFSSAVTYTRRGWTLASFAFARSAPPVNVVGATSFAAGTVMRYRPNVNPGVPLELFGPQYPGGKILNPAAFSAAAAGQQGNLGRNVLRGFGAFQIDGAVERRLQLPQRLTLRLRVECFNVLNRPNFGPPVNDLSSSLFGRSTQTLASSLGSGGPNGGFSPLYQVGGPRSIQLAARLEF